MFFLCPVFVWLGWLQVCEHRFLVNILIYFFALFLLSVLGPFIQQAAMEFLIPALTVSSYILRTEVKSTFLAGRKLKIRSLNERSVIQRCAPLSYLNRYLLCLAKLPAGASFPAGTAVTLCWCTQRPVHADWKLQSHLDGKSDGKSDCKNFQPVGTSVPLCSGTAPMLR